jgi:SNF2 family DNA or RNA helicase
VGIALHAASQVVLGELPWTAAAQDQAIDRVHRIGQDRPVTAWRIIASGTLDERMAELIGEKAAIGLAAIDGGVVAAGSEELGALDALVDLVTAALAQPRKRKARKARTPKAAAA